MYDDTNFSKYFSFFLYFQEPLVLSSSNPMIENSGLTDIHKQIYGYRESLISAIDMFRKKLHYDNQIM